MRLIKYAVIVSAISLFAIACDNSTSTNQTSNGATQPATVASPAPAAANAPASRLDSARATFSAACARCHKENGEGGLFELEDQKLKVPSLREGEAVEDTDRQLARQIANGGKGMPAFKSRLSQEQIEDLVRFIREEFQGRAAAGK